MKKLVIIASSVIGCLIIVSVGLFAFAYFKGVGAGAKPVPGAAQYIQPTATPLLTSQIPGPVTQKTPVSNPGNTPTPAPVGFDLIIEQSKPSESSVFLSVSVKVYLHAELSNTGDFTAHNVEVTTRARVGNDYAAIDGKQALVVGVGTVAARSTVPKEISFTLDMSLSQGQNAQSHGIYFEVVVSSTEGKSYIPLMLCDQTACAPA